MNQLSFMEGGGQAASPIRRQYLDIKRRYPDAILFFRLGDFYETFDDDARVVSAELEIVLTSRDMGRGDKVPLAGIPYHAADGYIARLIARGYKIAICEQLGTVPVRGLVPREVVRVMTPGTLTEETLLPPRSNNFLAALIVSQEGAGLALVDISTGELLAAEVGGPAWEVHLTAEMDRVRPAECLIPRSGAENPSLVGLLPRGSYLTRVDDGVFSQLGAERTLREHFQVATLDGFGLSGSPLAVRASGALLDYLKGTQPASLGQLESLHLYSLDQFMRLDASARQHLELVANAATGSVEGSLLGVLDATRTAMGGRLLRRWIGQPLLDISAIEERLSTVEALVKSPLGRAELGPVLSDIGDLERLASRAAQRTLAPRDCLGISRSLLAVPRLLQLLERRLPRLFETEGSGLDRCSETVDVIRNTVLDDPAAVVGEGVIRQGRSVELDELRSITGDTRRWIAGLERSERERTGVRSLKIGFNRVFGYYIEVTRPNLDLPVDEFARMKTGAHNVGEMLEAMGYQRKQTLANAERFVTGELKEQELKLQNAQAEIEALEKQIYAELLTELAAMSPRVRKTAQAIARLDAYLSFAEVAVSNRYCRPVVDDSTALSIRAGRHPVVERSIPAGEYVPNDCHLSTDETQIAVLTGPNMAGKSTYVLGVALTVIMAQIGSFVPAQEARLGVVDRVFTRVGAQHDVSAGKSTFLVEMAETANVLHNATRRSLVVLDEVGRGTSTYDGMAIARAVIEYLHEEPRLRCKTLFATHYHELTELEGLLSRVRNWRMDVLEEGDRVVFLHRVVPGGADRSYGIHVAQLAGVPWPVIRRAREILHQLEENGAAGSSGGAPFQQLVESDYSDVVSELISLDLTSMTPLQAIARLHDLQQKVLNADGH